MTSLFGKTHDDKMITFDMAISSIEKKYEDQLQVVVDHENKERPDKLSNHYILQWDHFGGSGLRYQIGFIDTYLPRYIQEEITSAFKEVFSEK